MRAVSLFSGVGGLDLGFERAGIETVLQVEIDQFCRQVLAKHWPDVRRIADVRDVTKADVQGVDVVMGGFPCQPVSDQGERRVHDDDRWMWPEFRRVVEAARPRYVAIENVPGLLKRGGREVLRDLAALGFDAEWTTLTARAFGAPHHRERVFIVAYPRGYGCGVLERTEERGRDSWDLPTAALTGWEAWRGWLRETLAAGDWDEPEAGLLGVDDGVPERVDRRRVKACGNAVVPQVAEFIANRIVAFDREVSDAVGAAD